MWKSLVGEIKKLLHPHSVTAIKMDGEVLDNGTIRRCGVFFFSYLLLICASTLIVSIDGLSLETNFTAVMATINNVGPGFGLAGPVETYAIFSPISKIVLSLDMLLGRLGIFPILILFAPQTWNAKK